MREQAIGAGASCGLALTLLVACTPGPEKVCERLDAFDRETPMPNFGRVGTARKRPSKLASCKRQLEELRAVDAAEYKNAARCLTRAKNAGDAWNCWVFYATEKQPAKQARVKACSTTCDGKRQECYAPCRVEDACLDQCRIAHEECVSACHFD